MRHGVESQGLLEQLSIELQELARAWRASIRYDKADIQILRMLGELRDEALLREVDHNNAILNFKIFRDTASYFNSAVSRRATSTTLIPDAAICRANSLPIPDEAPVTSAHGPNRSLSIIAVILLLPSICLRFLTEFHALATP